MPDKKTRIETLPTRGKMLLAVGVGALAALGHEPWGLWPLTLLGLVALAILLEAARDWKQAAWAGWAAGVGYFGVALSWIVEPFLVDVARHGWMAPFALVGISGGMALFWALGFGTARWLGGAVRAPLVLVVTLTLSEALRAYILTGFPWAMIAYVWVDTPVLQVASIFGPHGLTALTLLVTCGVWGLSGGPRLRAALSGIGLWAFFFGVVLALRPEAIAVPADNPVIRLVQPNAPQHQKWDPAMIPVFFGRQIEYTAAPGEPDLIVWPETSLPVLLDNPGGALARISSAAGDTPVVVGVQRRGERGYHNSLALLDGAGDVAQVYDKHHLVPFGEYAPGGDLAARFGMSAFAAQQGFGYAPGPGVRLLELGDALGTALPLICYEVIFPHEVNGAARRPDWLLQITNDAWFGTHSGPYQHLAQARFRAVEQGVPMIRVANTGVSAVIDATGRVLRRIPLGEAGYLDARLPDALPPTLYTRTGDLPLFFVFTALFAVLLAGRVRY